jgi:hypothetical protein
MDLYIRDVDEYSKDLRQGNKFAPEWPFRMGFQEVPILVRPLCS